jgi:hypothetical protein
MDPSSHIAGSDATPGDLGNAVFTAAEAPIGRNVMFKRTAADPGSRRSSDL